MQQTTITSSVVYQGERLPDDYTSGENIPGCMNWTEDARSRLDMKVEWHWTIYNK